MSSLRPRTVASIITVFSLVLTLLTPAANKVSGATPRQVSIFGAEIWSGAVASVAEQAGESGISWTRYNAIHWSLVEPVPGARDWSSLEKIDNDLLSLTAQGLTPIVIVAGTPEWAQQVPGSACGAIKADALDAFATFMRDLVERYKVAPYNVRYWEMWNEPDVDPSLVSGDSPFGCWGDEGDEFYGGGHYAEMLKQVYPAIKQSDPLAQVVLGGLLLGCDPTVDETCTAGKFLEGVLQNGGGSAVDVLGYHSYAYWHESDGDAIARNGSMLGKLQFVRSVAARYGVDKPIMMSEGGFICYPGISTCPGPEFEEAKARHVVRMYTRAIAHGLHAAIWYRLDGPGWREGGLLDEAQQPRPAFTTLKFLSTMLRGATFTEQLAQGTLEGYAFRRGSSDYHIYWQNEDMPTTIPLSSTTRAIYDKLGRTITPSGTSLSVGNEPVLIELDNTPPNLVRNPGFELDANGDGKPDGWSTHPNVWRHAAAKRTGSYGMLHYTTANTTYAVYQGVPSLEAGATYTFSGQVYALPTANDRFDFTIRVQWRDSNDAVLRTDRVKSYTKATGGWNLAEKQLTAPDRTSYALVVLVVQSLKGTVLVDDLVLRP